jgi:hypothetical protein
VEVCEVIASDLRNECIAKPKTRQGVVVSGEQKLFTVEHGAFKKIAHDQNDLCSRRKVWRNCPEPIHKLMCFIRALPRAIAHAWNTNSLKES